MFETSQSYYLFLCHNSNCVILGRWQQLVSGPVGPYLANGPRDRRLEAGQSIQLTCRVVGNPWPRVSWFKDNDQIIPDGQSLVVFIFRILLKIGLIAI